MIYLSAVRKLKVLITGKEDGVMSDEDKKKLLDMTSSMDVIIYSDSKTNIDNCKKELDAKLEKIYTKRKIEDWKELIKSLTKEEVMFTVSCLFHMQYTFLFLAVFKKNLSGRAIVVIKFVRLSH